MSGQMKSLGLQRLNVYNDIKVNDATILPALKNVAEFLASFDNVEGGKAIIAENLLQEILMEIKLT